FWSGCADHAHLHSFPTRRSSDLAKPSRCRAQIGRCMKTLTLAGLAAALAAAAAGPAFSAPASCDIPKAANVRPGGLTALKAEERSEEHTSELQSRENLVCRLLLE